MKIFSSLILIVFLSLAFSQFATAEEAEKNDSIIFLRHHIDLPQPVVYQDSIGVMGIGYHFTLFDWGNHVSFGGLGTAIGARNVALEGEEKNWDAEFYLQIPAMDLCLSKKGYGFTRDEADFEFSTAVLYNILNDDWGFRGLFSVGW